MNLQELIEKLAEKEHGSWSHWMKYLFSQCTNNDDGSMTIPTALVDQWHTQARTSYADLSEREKQSDRNRVNLILPIIEEYKQDGSIPSDEQAEQVTRPQIEALLAMVERNSLEIPIGASLETLGEITIVNISSSHIRIIGSSRKGKTCLAAAIIAILQQTHDAGFLQMALLGLDDKTSMLFEGMSHLATITSEVGQPVPLHTRNPRQVVEYLHLIRNLMDERYTQTLEEQEVQPHLLVYVEEFLSLKSHLDESLRSTLIDDLNELVIRGLKVKIHLMCCSQVDYADEGLKGFTENAALNIAFAVRPAAAQAAGFTNTRLLAKNWETKIPGQFVIEGTGCNDFCVAPDYDIKAKES